MYPKGLPNETRLMLCCTRTEVDTSLKHQIQELLRLPLDWEYLIEQSRYHEILPLLYYNLNKFHRQDIPETALTILKKSYYFTLTKNMRLWREFCCIQDAFNKAGIKVIPLKGIILSETLYHNLGLRPMVDIDILIQEKDLLIAEKQLIQLGYKIYLKDLPKDYWRRYHCHFQFCQRDKNIILELHWALAPPRPNKIDISEIWQRSGVQNIDHFETLTLSREDMLLSLCLHICKNISSLQYLKLKNLCDIHELISQYNSKLNWEYIINKIILWRLRSAFYYLCLLTKRYSDTPWPINELTKISPYFAQRTILNFFIPNLKKISRYCAYLLMLAITDTTVDRLVLGSQKLHILIEKTILLFSTSIHNKQR